MVKWVGELVVKWVGEWMGGVDLWVDVSGCLVSMQYTMSFTSNGIPDHAIDDSVSSMSVGEWVGG